MSEPLVLLKHRGPDDVGQVRIPMGAGDLQLGHTRLSIIDLTEDGHQPMLSRDGQLALVFNGEIYNYKELRRELQALGVDFRTETDTEVLMEAWCHWGMSSVERLVGMFAFAIYDAREGVVTLVRDAFGIKPLFYSVTQDSFTFASEVRALVSARGTAGRVNAERAYEYLVWGDYDYGDDTFIQDVKQLPSGHLLRFRLAIGEKPELRRWWRLSVQEVPSVNYSAAVERIRHLFLESVRLHLRADVPIGAALSGGVDSAAVVCAMRYLERDLPIDTFTYAGAGTGLDDEPWADLVNCHVSARAHKVHLSSADLARDLDDMLLTQGEPFGGTSIYAQYRVMKATRNAGVVVLLEGQGADELFAGYLGYPGARLKSLIDERAFLELFSLMRGWVGWPGRSVAYAAKDLLGELSSDRWLAYLHGCRRATRPPWIEQDALPPDSLARHVEAIRVSSPKGRQLSSTLRAAMTGRGLAALLRHSDRNAMRWSVESRVPFLVPQLAQAALELPEDFLLSSTGETKSVFRAAMRGIVPAEILGRRDKIGFATPEAGWLQGLAPHMLGAAEAAEVLPFLRPRATRDALNLAQAQGRNSAGQTWRLFNLCRWTQLMDGYLTA